MSTLLSAIFAILFAISLIAGLLFWALFFFVVLVRIADKGLKVEEGPRFGFLFERWPAKELHAYFASLDEDGRRRWFNRFLGLVPRLTDRAGPVFIIGVHALFLWLWWR